MIFEFSNLPCSDEVARSNEVEVLSEAIEKCTGFNWIRYLSAVSGALFSVRLFSPTDFPGAVALRRVTPRRIWRTNSCSCPGQKHVILVSRIVAKERAGRSKSLSGMDSRL